MDINKVCIVGGGTMGRGIAEVIAGHGHLVNLVEVNKEILQNNLNLIRTSLQRAVAKGKHQTEEVEPILERIKPYTDLEAAAGEADLVLESVPELLDLKITIFKQLSALCRPTTILASNTSQLSITALAGVSKHPERVLGMHWFNPAPVMKLVEIIRTMLVAEDTIQTVVHFAGQLGKETVVCKDAKGFITTRINQMHFTECLRMLEENIASVADIDKAVKLAFNYPMGPFELLDLVGLDVTLHAMEAMVEQYGDRYRPPEVLRNMVRAGYLGRKTGKGFYDYSFKTKN